MILQMCASLTKKSRLNKYVFIFSILIVLKSDINAFNPSFMDIIDASLRISNATYLNTTQYKVNC